MPRKGLLLPQVHNELRDVHDFSGPLRHDMRCLGGVDIAVPTLERLVGKVLLKCCHHQCLAGLHVDDGGSVEKAGSNDRGLPH